MLTRTRKSSVRGLAVALVAGLTSVSAAAMEEVIVYGSQDAARPEAERIEMRAELKQYLESLNTQLKEQLDAALDKALEEQPAAEIKLALTETSSRG